MPVAFFGNGAVHVYLLRRTTDEFEGIKGEADQ
jgi:hypothetical protein